MPDLLDKSYGSVRPKAQLARNLEGFRRLESGTLQRGELYGLVTGAPAPLAPGKRNPVLTSGKRSNCITCHGELEQYGPPLKSQPRRCQVCGTLKRRQYNDNQKSKKQQEPVTEEEADDLPQALAG